MKSSLPKELCVSKREKGTENEYFDAGKTYADVAEDRTITEVGIYKLVEIVEVSTIAVPTRRRSIKS